MPEVIDWEYDYVRDVPAQDWYNLYIQTLDLLADVRDENYSLKKSVEEASHLLARVEKDSCCYCPLENRNKCIDPEGRENGDECSFEKWKEYLINFGRKC